MPVGMTDSMVHKALRSLCINNGWSYGVVWRFDQRNSSLLTMEEVYYDEQMGGVIDNMLLQVHVLGNGIVGQAAFTNKHRWVFSDARDLHSSLGLIENQPLFQDDYEIHHQFVSGIQTIAFISVELRGVVQFGSTQKIPESIEFVHQTKKLFQDIQNANIITLPDNRPSSSDSVKGALSGLFASLISSGNFPPEEMKPIPKNYTEMPCSSTDPQCLTLNYGRLNSSETSLQGPLVQSSTNFNYSSSATTPCISTGGSSHSTVTSFELNWPSDIRLVGSQSVFDSFLETDFLDGHGIENVFDNLGIDLGCVQSEDFFDDMLMPVVSGGHQDFGAAVSESISNQPIGSNIAPQESLFSKLGLEPILNGVASSSNSTASSSFGDESSRASKRKMTSCSISNEQMQLKSFPCDSYSMTGGSTVVSQTKGSEESTKVSRKRARPGSRPKPKDRQQIQERIAELRKLIPNGVKMSIDSLLAQTIKHMLFLQSVTKHAEKLKQAKEQKEDEVTWKESYGGGGCGLSEMWACEVGSETMLDLVDVKDLSRPGQKLIQMICEERGIFLEIIDIIQGFGLTILKGVMEVRENKIWACFLVEAEVNRHVSKQEIYLSLHQLLYHKTTSEINSTHELDSVFKSFNQPLVPLPISLAETLL
ncbi:hypothetical protein NMG60_11026902 [Bertholletia excelsa]